MDSGTAAVIIYLVGGMGFFSALISLIALLTILRQLRSLQVYQTSRARAAAFAKPVPLTADIPFVPLIRGKTREVPRVQLSAVSIPREWQIPRREGTPDQVIINIEPDSAPTREESNVLRLINYLKKLKTAAG